jgi:hypothetical protein
MNSAFKNYLYDLKFGGRLGTKMASDIASNMAIGLITPIAQQIDPVKLGEHQRAMNIAIAYGERLNAKFRNTTRAKIEKLLTSYPAHGFVIDRKEVKELFTNVREPNSQEDTIFAFLLDHLIPNYGIDIASNAPKCWVADMSSILQAAGANSAAPLDVDAGVNSEIPNVNTQGSSGNVNHSETASGASPDNAARPTRKRRKPSGH